jgi:dihydroorotate dehydrogenase
MIEGNVSSSKGENLRKFKAQAKSILEGINPRTAAIQISAKIGPGEDF